jgi:hypothetical protein
MSNITDTNMSSVHRRLRVAVIGGLTRAAALWARAGNSIDVELEHHSGQTRGRGAQEIVAAVHRADVVVIITDPNSHGGVAVARRAASARACPHLLVKHLRPAGLGAVLADALAVARAANV